MWQHYRTAAPGRVAVIGADVYDGTPAQLALFRSQTGATYTLLLNAALNSGGNFVTDYADRDNYVVLDEQNVVRFNARLQGYVWGQSLDLNRIRGLVDSLLAASAAVEPDEGTAPRFAIGPSPFLSSTRLEWYLPQLAGKHARIAILDVEGRQRRVLYDGPAGSGPITVEWDGHDDGGVSLPPGVYLVRTEAAGGAWTRRIVRLR